MNRKQVFDFVNNDILPQIDSFWTWRDILPFKEIVSLVIKYRHKKVISGLAHIDDTLTAKVIDGYLYIDSDPVGRIAPKLPRPSFDEYAYYLEGQILARAEMID